MIADVASHDDLHAVLHARFLERDGIFEHDGVDGYWSNIDKSAQAELLTALQTDDFNTVVREKLPGLNAFVLDERRAAGLDLLQIESHQLGVDYGCMWGNLLLAAARRCRAMLGVDKTREHLLFLTHRMRAEKVPNVSLLHADLKHDLRLEQLFDFAIVNGVLEWLPEENDVALNATATSRAVPGTGTKIDPKAVQFHFLERVARSLRPGGKLYIAIENRYDYQHFLWRRDPHTQLRYVSVMPRRLANFASNAIRGRPYVNYIYSANELEALLRAAGFTQVEKNVTFPNYRYPVLILPLQRGAAKEYRDTWPGRPGAGALQQSFRTLRKTLDSVVYGRFKRLDLAPAFIFIAKR